MIGPGSLVEVVRFPCCGAGIGKRLVVTRIFDARRCHLLMTIKCDGCGGATTIAAEPLIIDDALPEGWPSIKLLPISWVREVPGEAELEPAPPQEVEA